MDVDVDVDVDVDEKDEENTTIESVRAERPGSYVFKIQSFSLLSETLPSNGYFGSPEFESGGRKWKLIIYPNGDCNEAVDDHISVYLVAEDKYIDSVGFEINCTFKIFVYDQLRDNFLTVQDTEVKRFNRYQRELGFSHLISLEKFKNPKNGYLVNDFCVFGVEIFVIPNIVQEGCLSVLNEPKDGIFTWKLDKISTMVEKQYGPVVFHIQGHKWKLSFYPKKDLNKEITCFRNIIVSLSLDVDGNYMVYTKGVLRLRNQLNDEHHEIKFVRWFGNSDKCWVSQIPVFHLEAWKGHILKDNVTLEVELNCISKTCSL